MSDLITPTEAPNDTAPRPDDDRDTSPLRTPRIIMIVLFCVGLAASIFLISAGSGTEVGHQPWKPTSVLRLVTTALNLNAEYPTPQGTEVKWLAQGLSAAAALLVAAWFVWLRTRPGEDDFPEDLGAGHDDHGNHNESGDDSGETRPESVRDRLSRLPLVTAAQIAMAVFVACMALSSLWAPWPEGAFGDTMIRLTAVIWAICLGRIFTPRRAIDAILPLVIILVIMSALGIWYHHERAPLQRLKFPIGNPIFLAAILLPGIILAIAILASAVTSKTSKTHVPPARTRGWAAWHPAILIAVSLVALLVMAWAFVLAESRGPAIGLAGGLFVALLILLPRRPRWTVFGLSLILTSLILMTHLWPVSWLESRPTTVRLRLYSWNYAWDFFTKSPAIGHGQGAYVLMAQAPSRTDALSDPQAFTSEFLGHAHSEWLEILADLGAVGFALIATSLALTFYAAVVAMRSHIRYGPRWWMILGLAGALAALIVEEGFNVGLRLPGLPFVFHTVLGLLWALSRTDDPDAPPQNVTPLLRIGTTTLLGLGAVAVLMVSVANWQTARAVHQLGQTVESRRWNSVADTADRALGFHWSIETRMKSLEQVAWAYHLAARHHGLQLLTMLQRQGGADPAEAERIQQIALEDLGRFRLHADAEMNLIRFIITIMPRYPDVCAMAAEACLLQQDIANAIARFQGEEPGTELVEEAARWLEMELDSNRYDADVALRLVQITPQAPMEQRLDWLRIPLRVNTLSPGYERVLAVLIQDPTFWPTMSAWARIAHATTQPEGASPLPRDFFAPESLRLSAAALKLTGQFGQAARLLSLALELYEPLADRFPAAPGFARFERARCLFLAHPDEPTLAIEVCRQGLEGASAAPEESRVPLRRALALYLTAAGEEAKARNHLKKLYTSLSTEQLDFEIARAYVELSSLVMSLQPERRPEALTAWLRRAAELVPAWPPVHQLAFNDAIERGDAPAALHHFETLRRLVTDPEIWNEWMSVIESRYDQNPTLQTVFARATSTRPAEPATQPLTRPALPSDNGTPILPDMPAGPSLQAPEGDHGSDNLPDPVSPEIFQE